MVAWLWVAQCCFKSKAITKDDNPQPPARRVKVATTKRHFPGFDCRPCIVALPNQKSSLAGCTSYTYRLQSPAAKRHVYSISSWVFLFPSRQFWNGKRSLGSLAETSSRSLCDQQAHSPLERCNRFRTRRAASKDRNDARNLGTARCISMTCLLQGMETAFPRISGMFWT